MMQIRGIILLFTVVLTFVSVALGGAIKGTGSCPIRQTVKSCLPKCLSDFECIGYKRCCPNVCGSMSCADISPVYTGSDPRQEGKQGVMCGNIKCQPGQKCGSDGSMKRPKCSW